MSATGDTAAGRDATSSASGGQPARPQRPPMPPVVYLRGAGVDGATFDRLHHALWGRGLWTLTDRTRAAHLSRGGLPVWMVDFSLPRSAATQQPDQVSIAQVRAIYTPASGAAGGQQLQLERLAVRRVDRPVRVGELDTETLADQVAAAVLDT